MPIRTCQRSRKPPVCLVSHPVRQRQEEARNRTDDEHFVATNENAGQLLQPRERGIGQALHERPRRTRDRGMQHLAQVFDRGKRRLDAVWRHPGLCCRNGLAICVDDFLDWR